MSEIKGLNKKGRCKKHPGYQIKSVPKPSKAYPNGCPTCLALWDQVEKPKKKKRKAPEHLAEASKKTQFKKGHKAGASKIEPDMTLEEMIQAATAQGASLVNEHMRIAGVARRDLNYKGVPYQVRLQALKWLSDRGFPTKVEEDKGPATIQIVNYGEVSFGEYKERIQKELGITPQLLSS